MKFNKKILKILFIILIILFIGLVISNISYGWNMELNKYENATAGKSGNRITNLMGAIIQIMSTIGAGIAIIMLITIGIQYVSKGAEGKAEAKKDLVGYIFGITILFGITGLLKLLQMFIDKNINQDL